MADHGHFCNHRNSGRGVANFYGLVLCVLLVAAQSAYAGASPIVWSGTNVGGAYASSGACGAAERAHASYAVVLTTTPERVKVAGIGEYGQTGRNSGGASLGYMCYGPWTCSGTDTPSSTVVGGCDPVTPPENAPNQCPKSGSAGYWNGPGGNGPKQVCQIEPKVPSGVPGSPGCKVAGNANFSTNSAPDGAPPDWNWGGDMHYTGEACSGGSGGGTPDSGQPDNGPGCKPPKVAGTANGVTICYTPQAGSNSASQSTSPIVKTTTPKDPDGNQAQQSSQSTTSCLTSGVCTTTTTTTTVQIGSNGAPIGQPVVTTSSSSCTLGPGCSSIAPIPKVTTTSNSSTPPTAAGGTGSGSNGPGTTITITTGGASGGGGGGSGGGNGSGDGVDSQFAGVCGAPPFCDGDAVLCAVAAATFKQECNWRPPPSPESAAYDLAKTKTGSQTGDLPGNSSVNLGPSSFNQTELLGAAAGMQDRTITVMGRAIVLPFSNVNQWLARLGMILQAVTFLLCMRIVTRG